MAEPDEEAQRLAIVCANVEKIRKRLRESRAGSDAVLEELLSAARGGGDVEGAVNVLHAVLQALGDAQGLYAYSENRRPTGRSGVHAAGVHHNHLSEPVFLCPAHRCSRYWWPQGPAPVPRCEISGDALRRDWL